ncbi:universal stress protein [Candidatus Methylacidiphilum fumarolicum]|uniref:Nucleotide-binding protein, UspA family n=2 Tax=Candidatus Methylacidiphilum fumarolicum TaxID=591154 RepID=I0JYF3_METFB|nr:universal stress protein [Candidatus Methylacidiphilum fumarolicum]MBW6414813.1 universal stress protein [Candidatus Methylacidiphilum fumarolicum]TFE67348.1 nucleotide-binding protein, UspA family [Candidatus Methylacidiphilum fumarolicum]TFE73325.1 universal stress protein [Candidatus Methylacidiphilum fumarolicum]TFE74106.1 universal stress protein [Candidatus Methylacidiphilum fumarolicum]TFE77044.1 nucleotide-binding protein, UspA family [Candidatus Methylacidiphilum fumarolicum]
MHVEKILVGYDGSESSKKALSFALQIAKSFSSKVTILSVMHAPEFNQDMEFVLEREKIVSDLKWAMEKAAEEKVELEVKTEMGDPADRILKLAKEGNFDLVVLGRRGLSRVGYWLTGSVSERVLRHSPCSILIVE